MSFWIFMFLVDLLIPMILIGFGWLLKNHPPKEINFLFGYRTLRSTKNQDTWNFAQQYCGKLWINLGLIMLPVVCIILFSCRNESKSNIGMIGGILNMIELIPLFLSIFITEHALKKKFENVN